MLQGSSHRINNHPFTYTLLYEGLSRRFSRSSWEQKNIQTLSVGVVLWSAWLPSILTIRVQMSLVSPYNFFENKQKVTRAALLKQFGRILENKLRQSFHAPLKPY